MAPVLFAGTVAVAAAACSSNDESDPAPAGAEDSGSDGSTSSARPPADGASPIDANAPPPPPTFVAARESLEPGDVAVLVNADDPQSVAVGAYYMQKRGVPASNLVSLHLGGDFATAKTKTISSSAFATWKSQIDAATPANVQAYAVTWIYPSIVDCMSLTSALAFGFDAKWCSAALCSPTAPSPYFSSDTTTPFTTHAMRPAMVIAGATTADATALIDRGVSADGTYPLATGYAVRTSDGDRSVRYPDFIATKSAWNHPDSLAFEYIDDSASGTGLLENKNDVLFYFTGLASVDQITTNHYLPGSMADHLTSYGGQIPDSGQMSILRWLEAGATGSFGTVVEPCNWTTKFPQASVAVARYFGGATMIEAYWKSVSTPGEGLFIGEPLARPFGTRASFANGTLTIKTTALVPSKHYRVESASSTSGPWTPVVSDIQVSTPALKTIVVPQAAAAFYHLVGQ